MKKKIILSLLVIVALFTITGCDKKETNASNKGNNNTGSNTNSNETKPDHKIYKYMKITSDNANGLLYNAGYIFDDPGTVSNGDTYYYPTLLVEFDTKTGKGTSAKFYTFFLDYEDDEWVNKSIEKYESSSLKSKEKYKNVKKGRVNDSVSYLTADIDINSHEFTQFISTYLIEGQDIEKYKDEIFFSRLYNYSSEPPHEEGDNYFSESLEGLRIEWSDSKLKAY